MKKIKLYLDNCCFNRPFDDQNHYKIYLETEAKLFIQRKILEGYYDLVWSFILDYENSANPDIDIKNTINKWEKISKETKLLSDDILQYSRKLNILGFGIKDSLHIACAIKANADYFLTVDRSIINKRNRISDITILNLLEFIDLEEDK
jgi:hypothetical protein